MQIKVRLFAVEAERAGQREILVAVPGEVTCARLRRQIEADRPALAGRLRACRFAVNHRFVDDGHRVEEDDEVALIGVVSGG